MTPVQASNRPGIDVVILSWNRLDQSLATIQNIRAQESVNPTIWVVDQGSDPECVETLRRYQEQGTIFLRELHRNVGVARGRNIGMSLGIAPFIVSIDNDAVFKSPQALSMVVRRFSADRSLAAIGFRVLNYYSGEDDEASWAYPRPLKKVRDHEFLTTRFAGGAHALRRDALRTTNWYDERLFFYWEELDLGYQLINHGWQILYDPSIVVLHKTDPENRTSWSQDRFYYLVRNRLYIDYKYFRSVLRSLAFSCGYFLKGVRNRTSGQALRGFRDAIALMQSLPSGASPLTKSARAYYKEYDSRPRGTLLRRLFDEVLEKCP